ncbi:MAG: hypothetical protein JNK21_11585, partial [Rhodospirillaceae bacterium]|nr:hypothetical protein [Rhodospirillaceae bacterium]
ILDTLAQPVSQFGARAYGCGVLIQDAIATHLRSALTHPHLRRLVREDRLSA